MFEAEQNFEFFDSDVIYKFRMPKVSVQSWFMEKEVKLGRELLKIQTSSDVQGCWVTAK